MRLAASNRPPLLLALLCASGAFAQDAGAVMQVEPWGDEAPTAAADAGVVETFQESDAGISTFVAMPAAATSTPALETFAEEPPPFTVRMFSALKGETMVDTAFESARNSLLGENVAEARFRANLGADIKLSPRFRAVLELKAQARLVTQRDFDRTKGFFEAVPGDVFLDFYSSKADVRIGMQRISLGANAGLAAVDALNPRDLRERILGGDPEDAFLSTFAVRAQGEVGKLAWLAAYAPFFQSSRFFLVGQDEALLQPALAPAFDARRIDPSVEDFNQERALETSRPPLFAGDVALHVNSTGKIKVGATWAWVNEKMPRVIIDGELQQVLDAQAAGKTPNAAATASLANRFQAGETLFRGHYLRQHIFALEATALVGPAQVDVDVSYTPRQTFFDGSFAPINKEAFSWVLGVSQASDSKFVYGVTYTGLVVPDVLAAEQLILLEPATAMGANRAALLHLLMASASYTLLDDRLELSARGGVELIQGSFAVSPRVTWLGIDHLKLWLSGEFNVGNQYSPFGYFSRNNKVVFGARYDFF